MTKQITVGPVKIGGGAPVSIQSMLNTRTTDVEGSLLQIRELAAAGCEIARLAVYDQAGDLSLAADADQLLAVFRVGGVLQGDGDVAALHEAQDFHAVGAAGAAVQGQFGHGGSFPLGFAWAR